MSLHLEFRPRDFNEVVGNEAIVKTIENQLNINEFPHAVLLHGPSGCGKTTLARIISEKLGCNLKSSDYQELDIAQLTGVDTAREIRANMNFSPMEGQCRVYLLDEFHMSSKNFQNAMLKALEDCPKHVYFILCTTDPQKIINTVKTRCTKYKVKSLNDKEMEKLINWVLTESEVNIEENIIEEIVDISDGCPREALVTLNSIIDLPPDKRLDVIQGQESEREVRELCQAMLKGQSWKVLAKILKGLKGVEPEQARYAITGYMRAVALNNYNKDSVDRAGYVFECFKETFIYTKYDGLVFACYDTTI